jgi:tetratricopeptide (TPR) repeat protein
MIPRPGISRFLLFALLLAALPAELKSDFRMSRARAETLSWLVLPMENSSRPEIAARLDWLGEGLAELSMDRLAGPGRLIFPREEWQAAAERLGLPSSPDRAARFSRATMIRLAELLDADATVFGRFASDGKKLSVTVWVLLTGSAADSVSLSPPMEESGNLEEVMEIHARLIWRVARHLDSDFPLSRNDFVQRLPQIRLDAFENYVRGMLAADDAQKLRLWREAARLDANWSDPPFALGLLYFAAEDYATAAGWFSRVRPETNHGRDAAFYAGTCHLLRNDPRRAEAAFAPGADFAGREPARAELLNNYALAHARQQNWPEGLVLMLRATQQSPEDADLWVNLGLMQLRAGDPLAAARAFREALNRQAEETSTLALLIAALQQAGKQAEANAERARASGALPAVSEQTLRQFERFKMRLELPVTAAGGVLSSRSAQPLRRALLRGRDAANAGNWEEAQRQFSAAVLLKPDSQEGHAGLAEALEMLGRVDEAIREWRAALWAGDDGALRMRLARALLKAEPPRKSEAIEELRAALRLTLPASLRSEVRQLLGSLEAQPQSGGKR